MQSAVLEGEERSQRRQPGATGLAPPTAPDSLSPRRIAVANTESEKPLPSSLTPGQWVGPWPMAGAGGIASRLAKLAGGQRGRRGNTRVD